ncbi:MAG TPA: DegV family protein [Firmicutes bacterium]|jgi:DegV family protein with EDD domain|nr:DegV family protein [Bacillota bacterium]
MALKIVTDSTADLPLRWIRELNITVVPLNIHFGDEVYKDGVDIWSEEFYNRLRNEPLLPNTSQPSPGEFLKIYQSIASPGDTIIGIYISQEMSGTAGSAKIAAELPGNSCRIEIIDSRFVSMALGLIVIKAARMAKNNNVTAAEIIAAIHDWQKQIAIYFTLNSLEYLHRTGRIGKASTLLGSLLNIRPILSISDGVIIPSEKVRGNIQKVASVMVEKLVQQYGKTPLMICVLHTEIPEVAQILQGIAEKNLNIAESYPSIVGPIVGSHAGPNTVGIIALPAQ